MAVYNLYLIVSFGTGVLYIYYHFFYCMHACMHYYSCMIILAFTHTVLFAAVTVLSEHKWTGLIEKCIQCI